MELTDTLVNLVLKQKGPLDLRPSPKCVVRQNYIAKRVGGVPNGLCEDH